MSAGTAATYPAPLQELGAALFLQWLGSHYARSARHQSADDAGDAVTLGEASIGRRWSLAYAVVDTMSDDSTVEFDARRAALEKRLDAEGRSVAVWVPRGAIIPADEPAMSEFVLALESATALDDGRLEVRRPVNLYLRRTAQTGSVVTALGGYAAHWAQFTNKVPGSYQLNSQDLFRLPHSEEERLLLANRIVNAAAQPDVDDGLAVSAFDTWTANDLGEGRSFVAGVATPEGDEASAALRRRLRRQLKVAETLHASKADARALCIIGAATYADDEKLSWALRGMDPRLYGGFDIITVIADGLVKTVLEPRRNSLPWDAPLG